jgi:ParB family transcriptional regulator, chromosome partitioning protein
VAKPKRGMGRGLEAILSVSGETQTADELRELPIELIVPNPTQPRRRFEEEALNALAGSLGERGVLQPVLVRPKPGGMYELVAGERRWRAAQIAGLTEIPALVRPRDDAATLELALIENMAREDLNPIEEARACMALVEELGLTREEVGRRVGRSRVAVSNLLRLLDLPEETIELIEQEQLSEGHGRALLLAEGHTERRRLGRDAAREGWSVRVLESRAREANKAGGAAPKKPTTRAKRGVHPDQEQAAATIATTLEEALGAEVQVRVEKSGGYRAELSFDGPEEALALAHRLGQTRRCLTGPTRSVD